MVVGRRVRLMGFAMMVVAMPPEHQLFQNEKSQDAEQHHHRHVMRIAMLQRMRQDFQEGGTEQRANRVGNQDIDPMRPQGHTDPGRSQHAEQATGQGNRNDPGKGIHETSEKQKSGIIRPPTGLLNADSRQVRLAPAGNLCKA